MEFRVIDYEEGVRQPLHYYLAELQKRGYVFGTDYLPWDGGLKSLGSGRSIEELMKAAGRKVRVAPRLPIADGINAARTIFPLCYFDEQRTAEGVRHLRMYRYGEMQSYDGPTREPLHNLDSHCADAWRCLSVSIRQPQKERERDEQRQRQYSSPWT
jgi:phage terminase large subunit